MPTPFITPALAQKVGGCRRPGSRPRRSAASNASVPTIEFSEDGYPKYLPAEDVPVTEQEKFSTFRFCSVYGDPKRQWCFYWQDKRVCMECQDVKDGGKTKREWQKMIEKEKAEGTWPWETQKKGVENE